MIRAMLVIVALELVIMRAFRHHPRHRCTRTAELLFAPAYAMAFRFGGSR